MNTPLDHDHDHLRYAEYVLGVLDADARAEVVREVETSDEARTAVELWRDRLYPLDAEIAPAEPPPYLWHRIRADLQLQPGPRTPPTAAQPGLWQNLRFWHWLGLGASAIAAACLLILLVPRYAPAPTPPAIPYMASTITQTNGRVGWTATMDIAHARMVVVPAAPQSLASNRAPELWLIPAGQKPIAVGIIATNAPTTIKLAPELLARLGPTAALAVSVEPPGGSPTGQPTGPVIAKGAIGAATESTSGSPVALLHFPGDLDRSA